MSAALLSVHGFREAVKFFVNLGSSESGTYLRRVRVLKAFQNGLLRVESATSTSALQHKVICRPRQICFLKAIFFVGKIDLFSTFSPNDSSNIQLHVFALIFTFPSCTSIFTLFTFRLTLKLLILWLISVFKSLVDQLSLSHKLKFELVCSCRLIYQIHYGQLSDVDLTCQKFFMALSQMLLFMILLFCSE